MTWKDLPCKGSPTTTPSKRCSLGVVICLFSFMFKDLGILHTRCTHFIPFWPKGELCFSSRTVGSFGRVIHISGKTRTYFNTQTYSWLFIRIVKKTTNVDDGNPGPCFRQTPKYVVNFSAVWIFCKRYFYLHDIYITISSCWHFFNLATLVVLQ